MDGVWRGLAESESGPPTRQEIPAKQHSSCLVIPSFPSRDRFHSFRSARGGECWDDSVDAWNGRRWGNDAFSYEWTDICENNMFFWRYSRRDLKPYSGSIADKARPDLPERAHQQRARLYSCQTVVLHTRSRSSFYTTRCGRVSRVSACGAVNRPDDATFMLERGSQSKRTDRGRRLLTKPDMVPPFPLRRVSARFLSSIAASC